MLAGMKLLQMRCVHKPLQLMCPFLAPYSFVEASLERGSPLSSYNIEYTLPRLLVRDGARIQFTLEGFEREKTSELKAKIVVSSTNFPLPICDTHPWLICIYSCGGEVWVVMRRTVIA